jgi:hypothetical protein
MVQLQPVVHPLAMAEAEHVLNSYQDLAQNLGESDWYSVFQDHHKFAGRDEGVHASRRRLVSRIYAIDSFKDLEKYAQDAVSHFMSKLHELQGSKIGLGLRLQLFAFGKYFSSACTTLENWLRCDRRGHLLQTLWVHGRSKR